MKSKSELIEISGILDTDTRYCSFYEFAANYIRSLKEKGKNNAEEFFKVVSTLGNNSSIRENYTAFGKKGAGSSAEIKKWCSYICGSKELKGLSLNELHYVMGYCARRAKIASVR